MVWYKAMAFSATHLGMGCLSESSTVSDAVTYNQSKLDLKVFHDLTFSKDVCFSNEEVLPMEPNHVDFQKYLSFTYDAFGTLLTLLGNRAEPTAAATIPAATTATATMTVDKAVPTGEVVTGDETGVPTAGTPTTSRGTVWHGRHDMVEQQVHHFAAEIQMAINILGEPYTLRGIPRTNGAPGAVAPPTWVAMDGVLAELVELVELARVTDLFHFVVL
jgi:hypothetical protein